MEASEGVVSQSGLCVIAQPVCNEKLAGRALKLVRKGSKIKAIRRGVKEIHKAFRKKEAGILILAGNVSPIDVLSHFPPLAEEHDIPYAFVNSKEELGAASATKRPTSCILVVPQKSNADFMEAYNKVHSAFSDLSTE